MRQANLTDLIGQAKLRDQEAVMEIVDRFEYKINKSLYQTSLQNREDLKQELLLKFIEIIYTFDPENFKKHYLLKMRLYF